MDIITYAITVCDEHSELDTLLSNLTTSLSPYLQSGDNQILIQADSNRVTEEVKSVVKKYSGNIKYTEFPLNNDFATFKNNIRNNADGNWIYQIDADEYPNKSFITKHIFPILESNKDTELILVPRINIVNGITEEHISKWGWNIEHSLNLKILDMKSKYDLSEGFIQLLKNRNLIVRDADESDDTIEYYNPIINFPDFQYRLYKNSKKIFWVNKVHEVITGYNTYSQLPANWEFCLYHIKDINRQEKQNNLYKTISR
jgi:hypothetical protein